MSKKDFQNVATILGRSLAQAWIDGGEDRRTDFYDRAYRPIVEMMIREYPRFDPLRFAGFVGAIETAHIAKLRETA